MCEKAHEQILLTTVYSILYIDVDVLGMSGIIVGLSIPGRRIPCLWLCLAFLHFP